MSPTAYNQSSPALVERFERIYGNTYAKLFDFAKYFVWNDDLAKDVVQECYIRLWEHMDEIRDDDKLMPLLRTYITHITIDVVRKNARDLRAGTSYHARQSNVSSADEIMDMQELLRRYHDAVNGLPPMQRKVFTMVREEGLTHKDVSEKLDISNPTVKRHMGEALHTLRTKLSTETLLLILLLPSSSINQRSLPDGRAEIRRSIVLPAEGLRPG